jgi:hypothetical protein
MELLYRVAVVTFVVVLARSCWSLQWLAPLETTHGQP